MNSYRFDAADRLIEARSTTAAGSHSLAYDYDSLNRLKTRTLSGTGITAPEITRYSWDLADRLLGHTTTMGSTPHRTDYEYDAAGRLAARHVQAGASGKLTQRYGYDLAERLSQIKYLRNEGTASEQLIEQIDYRYDAKGQRIARTTLNNHGTGLQDTPFTASYDAANRMTAITLSIAGVSKSYQLSHDANGNLTGKQNTSDVSDKTSYRWDSSNRLIGIEQPHLSASFTYDAYGRRIQNSITRNGQTSTVQYLYEGQQALGEIRDRKLSHRLLTGLALDETIARMAIDSNGSRSAGNSRLYMTDALNSVIAQMNDDDQASLANSYAYSPYGQSEVIGIDSTGNPIQYTSRENDGTGLIYYRARYYDPELRRFTQFDLIGLRGGLNLFTYVEGQPLSAVDPTGELLFVPIFVGAGIGALTDLAIQLAFNGGKLSCVSWKEVAISAAAAGVGLGVAQKFGTVTSHFGKGRETFRYFKSKGKLRVEQHPISKNAPDWASYPHWHPDFIKQPLPIHHLPLIEPLIGAPAAVYNATKDDCECEKK